MFTRSRDNLNGPIRNTLIVFCWNHLEKTLFHGSPELFVPGRHAQKRFGIENGVAFVIWILRVHFNNYLPGQRWVLHLLVSAAGPSPMQSFPPFAGWGLVQERERCWNPPAHVWLQRDQGPQFVYPPWIRKTGNKLIQRSQLMATTLTKKNFSKHYKIRSDYTKINRLWGQ